MRIDKDEAVRNDNLLTYKRKKPYICYNNFSNTRYQMQAVYAFMRKMRKKRGMRNEEYLCIKYISRYA